MKTFKQFIVTELAKKTLAVYISKSLERPRSVKRDAGIKKAAKKVFHDEQPINEITLKLTGHFETKNFIHNPTGSTAKVISHISYPNEYEGNGQRSTIVLNPSDLKHVSTSKIKVPGS